MKYGSGVCQVFLTDSLKLGCNCVPQVQTLTKVTGRDCNTYMLSSGVKIKGNNPFIMKI